jgi:transmembrane sensor
MEASQKQDFSALLTGYLRESLTQEELTLFLEQANLPENLLLLDQFFMQDLTGNLPDITSPLQAKAALERFKLKITAPVEKPVRRIQFPIRWVAAAVCLLLAGATFYIIKFRNSVKNEVLANAETIQPIWLTAAHIGGTLYLANGDSIELGGQRKGVIAIQDAMQVIQSGGAVNYLGSSHELMFNKITTGRGKLWQVLLPDHTRVWLNASSSIKYPLVFEGNERAVEVTGEVYLEVIHDSAKPFRVKAGRQVLEDIGTSFNISAYSDDSAIITTLITGSVRVESAGHATTILPGEQAIVEKGINLTKIQKKVNVESVLAWKNGRFDFQNADLQTVTKQISRWYNVDVRFEGPVSKEHFSGQIEKSLSLAQVLKGLQQPHVQFKQEDNNRIVVLTR